MVGRKCPLGETRKREERRLSPDPIKRKRDPLVARPPLLRVDPRDSEPANKIQINSAVHTKLSHLPLPDRVLIPEQFPPPGPVWKRFTIVSKFQYFRLSAKMGAAETVIRLPRAIGQNRGSISKFRYNRFNTEGKCVKSSVAEDFISFAPRYPV